MEKEAGNRFPLHEMLKRRWSPRAFAETAVEKEKLQSLFEAARWSPSLSNEQPWRFIVGVKPDETWQRIFDALVEGNRVWNVRVPVLVAAMGMNVLTNTQKPYSHYQYDTGQSVAHLSIQAMSMGLFVHQMAGFDPEKIIYDFNVPANYQPLTVIAIGYPGNPDDLPDYQKKREYAARTRKDFSEFVFSGNFGNKFEIFE